MAKRGRKPYSQAKSVAIASIRDIYKGLRRRIKNIEAKYGETFATKEYYSRGLDKLSTKGLSQEQLGKLLRDVEYVSSLPSSYVSGVKNYLNVIQPILDLKDVSESLPSEIFEIYGRLVEEKRVLELFKYQVLETITDLVMGGYTKEEIADNITGLYETLISGKGVKVSNGFQYGGKVRRY